MRPAVERVSASRTRGFGIGQNRNAAAQPCSATPRHASVSTRSCPTRIRPQQVEASGRAGVDLARVASVKGAVMSNPPAQVCRAPHFSNRANCRNRPPKSVVFTIRREVKPCSSDRIAGDQRVQLGQNLCRWFVFQRRRRSTGCCPTRHRRLGRRGRAISLNPPSFEPWRPLAATAFKSFLFKPR